MTAVLWIAGIYLAIGCVVMAVTYDREQDGWLWGIVLWPLQLASKVW